MLDAWFGVIMELNIVSLLIIISYLDDVISIPLWSVTFLSNYDDDKAMTLIFIHLSFIIHAVMNHL